MQGLFSKRFKRALEAKMVPFPSFSRVLRKRLAMTCKSYVEEWRDRDWFTDTEEETLAELRKAYGRDTLRVQDEQRHGDRDATGFEDFMVFAYPHHVLDALEAFYRLLSNERKHSFQVALNGVLAEEESPWRMCDGRMYMVDSRFLDALKDQVEEEMKREGFLGAYEEFRDARGHLLAGSPDDAIHKANRAFESALKSLLNQREGTADDLLRKLREETHLLHAVPVEAQKAIVSSVLQGLPVLRHKLAGHGQGANPVTIPRAYGELAVNLAATYIKFLFDLKRELIPAPVPQKSVAAQIDDDTPF